MICSWGALVTVTPPLLRVVAGGSWARGGDESVESSAEAGRGHLESMVCCGVTMVLVEAVCGRGMVG